MSEKNQQSSSINGSDLKEILATVLAEVRKPKDLTPGELAAQTQNDAMRRDRAELESIKQAGFRQVREQCPHRQANQTASVAEVKLFSSEQNTDFLICTKCQAKIKPAKGPYDEIEGEYIYDRNLYYSLIGSLPRTTY